MSLQENLMVETIIGDNSLSLFQKILLTTDGTVTNLLKLYTGEMIKVKKIRQEIALSGKSEELLCSLETPVLKRDILLCGKNRNYVYCESIFVFQLLSRSVQYKLLETDQPVGLMWREEKLETYREVIDYKVESAQSLVPYFDIQPQTPILSRTYLIYQNKIAFGAITEKFPATFFKEGSE